MGKLYQLIQKGHPASIMFYLKTRCNWKEKHDITSDDKPLIPVNRPAPMNRDEWMKAMSKEGKLTLNGTNGALH
jgi:hypothetical protein